MAKLFYGVGRNSRRKHKTVIKGKRTSAYRSWHSMLMRCYSAECQKINTTYIGCEIADEWHDFQDFADWFDSQEFSNLGYQLDKDILQPGNKVYSSKNCCFVPHEINSLLLDGGAIRRGDCPQGVHFYKSMGRFMARLSVDNKTSFLGYFDCPNEAHQAYKKAKEAYVKTKALEWQGRIADNVFQALMDWTLDS